MFDPTFGNFFHRRAPYPPPPHPPVKNISQTGNNSIPERGNPSVRHSQTRSINQRVGAEWKKEEKEGEKRNVTEEIVASGSARRHGRDFDPEIPKDFPGRYLLEQENEVAKASQLSESESDSSKTPKPRYGNFAIQYNQLTHSRSGGPTTGFRE